MRTGSFRSLRTKLRLVKLLVSLLFPKIIPVTSVLGALLSNTNPAQLYGLVSPEWVKSDQSEYIHKVRERASSPLLFCRLLLLTALLCTEATLRLATDARANHAADAPACGLGGKPAGMIFFSRLLVCLVAFSRSSSGLIDKLLFNTLRRAHFPHLVLMFAGMRAAYILRPGG